MLILIFIKTYSKNRFSILLSRSEGLPTSIITTMKSGLIPIISDYCGSNFWRLGSSN